MFKETPNFEECNGEILHSTTITMSCKCYDICYVRTSYDIILDILC